MRVNIVRWLPTVKGSQQRRIGSHLIREVVKRTDSRILQHIAKAGALQTLAHSIAKQRRPISLSSLTDNLPEQPCGPNESREPDAKTDSQRHKFRARTLQIVLTCRPANHARGVVLRDPVRDKHAEILQVCKLPLRGPTEHPRLIIQEAAKSSGRFSKLQVRELADRLRFFVLMPDGDGDLDPLRWLRFSFGGSGSF